MNNSSMPEDMLDGDHDDTGCEDVPLEVRKGRAAECFPTVSTEKGFQVPGQSLENFVAVSSAGH